MYRVNIIFSTFPYNLKGFIFLLTLIVTLPVYAAKPGGRPPQTVIVAPVVQQQISDRVEALATAEANESVTITSNVNEKVKVIHFEDGQQVSKGQVLVELLHDEEDADLYQARALLGERELNLQRVRRLAKKSLSSTDEVDKARLGVDQAKALISATQARINDRVIKAPFSGIVGLRQISVGALVESGDMITNLDDIHFIKVDFTIPAVFLSEVKPGLKIEARADAIKNHVYEGVVKSIDSRVDPETRSIRIRAILTNDNNRIVPGILMQVDLLRNTRDALIIPEEALLSQADKHFVLRKAQKDGNDIVQKQQVKIGTRLAGKVEIINGLKAGDHVVTHGNDKARHGSKVKVLAVDDGSKDIEAIIKGKPLKGKQP